MPNTAEPTVNPDDNAKSICEWYRNIVAGEESYFQKAAECQLELNHAKERISDLRAELRANPTPEQWRELAKEMALSDSLMALALQPPTISRRERLLLRKAAAPDFADRMRQLVTWTEGYAQPRLAAARKADSELSEQLDSREPIVSGPARKLESLLVSAAMVTEKLAIRDDDTGAAWVPFQGLVALAEELLK